MKRTTEAFSQFLGVATSSSASSNHEKIHKSWGSADNVQVEERKRDDRVLENYPIPGLLSLTLYNYSTLGRALATIVPPALPPLLNIMNITRRIANSFNINARFPCRRRRNYRVGATTVLFFQMTLDSSASGAFFRWEMIGSFDNNFPFTVPSCLPLARVFDIDNKNSEVRKW